MNYLLSVFLIGIIVTSYPSSNPESDSCIRPNEEELATLVNQYRTENDLPPIPLSKSLTIVAKAHVEDLHKEKPFDESNCNPHSWSDQGAWEACCYGYAVHNGPCMWNKPRELTDYQGDGFEIVMFSESSQFPDRAVSPKEAIDAWADSKNHNAVILNKGIWADVEWKAMGVGIHRGFAAMWFGREKDISGPAKSCTN